MGTEARPRRDVERNHEAILTAAIAVLADAPQATMADIAHASGTGRSTLYRHFPDREALIAAIFARIHAEAQEIVTGWLPGDPENDAVDVLAGLCNALAAMAEGYRFLEHHGGGQAFNKHPDRPRIIGQLLIEYVTDQQLHHGLRSDLPADWIVAMLAGIIKQAAARPMDPKRVGVVSATVRSLLTAAPESSTSSEPLEAPLSA